jgi:hypothetical protein
MSLHAFARPPPLERHSPFLYIFNKNKSFLCFLVVFWGLWVKGSLKNYLKRCGISFGKTTVYGAGLLM